LLMFRTGSRKRNVVLVFFALVFMGGFYALIDLYPMLIEATPLYFHGYLATLMSAFMKVGMGSATTGFVQYFWVEGTPYTVIAWLATLSVGLTSTFKLATVVQAAGVRDLQGIFTICASTFVFEVLGRNDFVKGGVFRLGVLKWRPTTMYDDLCKQASFKATHFVVAPLLTTIFVLAIRQSWLFDVHGSADSLFTNGMFWGGIMLCMVTNALTDLVTLQIQKKPGMGYADEFQRLQCCGEHTSIWTRPAEFQDLPQVQNPPASDVEDASEIFLFGRRIPTNWAFQVGVVTLMIDCWFSAWEIMVGKAAGASKPFTCCSPF